MKLENKWLDCNKFIWQKFSLFIILKSLWFLLHEFRILQIIFQARRPDFFVKSNLIFSLRIIQYMVPGFCKVRVLIDLAQICIKMKQCILLSIK